MGTHLRVPSEGYPMNTNMTLFQSLKKKIFASFLFRTKVASVLDGLAVQCQQLIPALNAQAAKASQA